MLALAPFASDAPAVMQTMAAKHNLHLNHDKAKLILCNSDASIHFQTGVPVQQVSSLVYLGGLIDHTGKPGPEVRHRL